MKDENVSKNIAVAFKKFINQFDYDPFEVACVVNQVLKENNIEATSKQIIGINLFDK